jgi:hypothetical protein
MCFYRFNRKKSSRLIDDDKKKINEIIIASVNLIAIENNFMPPFGI